MTNRERLIKTLEGRIELFKNKQEQLGDKIEHYQREINAIRKEIKKLDNLINI